jgi:hypothetical protein
MAIRFDHKPGLVVYLTAGDPSLDATRAIAIAAIDAGAAVIELGVPFSDPLADGPVIQRAMERAVARGTRLSDVLQLAREIRAERPAAGLVIFSYLNPVLRYGLKRFADDAAAAGVDGVLATDLIVEEAGEYLAELARRRAAGGHCHALQRLCLRHFAHRHYRHPANAHVGRRSVGCSHPAMDWTPRAGAAGGRGVRHLKCGSFRPGGRVRGCRGRRQRHCRADRTGDLGVARFIKGLRLPQAALAR